MLIALRSRIYFSRCVSRKFRVPLIRVQGGRTFSITMSWMDSWSRPNKQSAVPPPLYLTHPETKYCSACGRMIGARRSHKKDQEVKYCSDACRKNRLRPTDKKIDRTILAMLEGREDSGLDRDAVQGRFKKGDRRIVITMNEIERVAFDRTSHDGDDPASKTDEDFDDEDMQKYLAKNKLEAETASDQDSDSDHGVTLSSSEPADGSKPQAVLVEEQKRLAGQRRADEREMVRRSARRAVVFGFPLQTEATPPSTPQKNKKSNKANTVSEEPSRRHCEALMNGKLVDPSFAKGNWSIRWRDD